MMSDLPTGDGGQWQLDLQSGAASFSEWFHQRLRWPAEVKHRRLADLRPNLPAGAWEALLLAIRAHLERQVPLDMPLRVEVAGGVIQWWRVLGSTERNSRGKPVSLAGTMQDVSPEPHRDDPDGAG
jgi:hypothetical protein